MEVHKHAKKKEAYPTEQAWSVIVRIIRLSGKCFLPDIREVPSGQDNSILPARVANHSA